MKSILFAWVLLFSFAAFAKNRVLYTVAVPGKKYPDLYAIMDYKKGTSKKLIDSDVAQYVSSEEFIAYVNKDGRLFLIKDFESMTKTEMAQQVVSLNVNGGNLFFEVATGKQLILWSINNFREPKPFEIISDYTSYSLDR